MPAPVRDLSGLMLGEYRVGSLMGVGGMGAVYEGLHPVIGKRVAVKVLLPSLSADAELVKRFVAEARSVNEIRHRNIVDIFAFGQLPDDGSHYFMMEYLEGEPFDAIVRRGAMPVYQALYWCEEVLEALGAAHDFGIIHRDVKPSNVFMVQPRAGRRYVKLLDFGIAKLASGNTGHQTQASVVIGTPVYMSPEQARGRTIGPTTDLYALGCMLFEMVTGRVLFPAENQNQVMFMHAEDAPPLAKSLNPAVPDAVDDLLQKLLKKDPAQRPQTAEEVRLMCEVVRRGISQDTTFTQVPAGPKTGDGFKSVNPSGRPPTPIEAMDSALQRSVATPSPTRPSPLVVAGTPFAPTMMRSPSSVVPVAAPQDKLSVLVPRPSKLPWLLGAVTVGALALAGWKMLAPAPPPVVLMPPPPETVKVEAMKPAVVDVPKPAPAPAVVVPEPAPAPAPVAAKPPPAVDRDPGPTQDKVAQRIQHIERRLQKKKQETGDDDPILTRFLAQAKADAKVADTPAKRKAVMRQLDDIKAQLGDR